ncbi:MAG: Gfo/Idh/MocA family oxidoreductase [Clostridiales bacterium]|jgi:predicted dehydrogenase|nr:Gfo/Idh/MocA family oxidoreductase [Clostridiales bacterium]
MIKVAIIGCGNISGAHIGSYLKFSERCKIVALVDIFPEKAEAAKKRFSLDDAAVFASHEEMLESDVAIDLASNCTPPYVHAEISINCMNKGLHVLVEKPMATCLKECDEMLAAEKRNGVILSCGAQNRFLNMISKLERLADSEIAGKIRCAHVDSLWWRGHCYYDLWWRGTWEKEGGGPTLNHAVHQIDMLNWIKKELPAEVTAVLSNVMHDNSECEDLSFAILKYDDGALAEVTSSVVHHGGTQSIVLQCENAKIAAPFSVAAEISKPNGFGESNAKLEKQITEKYNSLPSRKHEGFDGEIDDVLSAIENNSRPLITGIDGRKTVELITAIYKSGFLKQTVSLPLSEDDDFYTFEGVLKNAIRFYKKTTAAENLGDSDISLGNFK